MSMSRKKCCVPGCLESGGSHKTLHLFPNQAKDRERFCKWVSSIGGYILGLQDEDIYKYRSVCHAHFEEKFCCRYDRISNIDVPTLHLPGTLSLPKFTFEERRPLRQIQSCPVLPAMTSSESTTSPPMLYDETPMQENMANYIISLYLILEKKQSLCLLVSFQLKTA